MRSSTIRPLHRLAVLVVSLLFCSVWSAGSAAPLMQGVVLRTLPNGLRLLVREQHSAALTAVDVWVRAGSGREQPMENGAAHFLEHLLFKGTPTRKPGEIDGAIEDLGATLSAFTMREGAHFCTTVPSAHTRTAVDVLADALQHSLLAPEEVERERAVILDELARAQNDPQKEATNRAFAELYPNSPYANPVLGTPPSIRSLSRDAIVTFYRRWYTPSNTTVVIVGDTTPDRAEEMVRSAFGSWAGVSPTSAPAPAPAPALPTSVKPEQRSVAATSIGVAASSQFAGVGFKIEVPMSGPEIAVGLVTAAMLGDTRSGRIATALAAGPPEPATRSPVPPVEVTGEFTPLPGGPLLLLSGTVPAGKAADFLQTADSEISRLAREAPGDAQMDGARRQVIGPYLYDVETYGGQARALGRYDVLGDYTTAQSLVDSLLAVKPADVTAFAKRWLTAENRVGITLNPPSHP